MYKHRKDQTFLGKYKMTMTNAMQQQKVLAFPQFRGMDVGGKAVEAESWKFTRLTQQQETEECPYICH